MYSLILPILMRSLLLSGYAISLFTSFPRQTPLQKIHSQTLLLR